MKYLSLQQIRESLKLLRPHHPVMGITFLVLKKAGAPVGSKKVMQLDSENHEFLKRYYRANPKSDHFFKVLAKGISPDKHWVEPNYASTGLQAINTQTAKDAFLHTKNENAWGFSPRYTDVLLDLNGKRKVPLFHLAVWIYRDESWTEQTTRDVVIRRFIQEYSINNNELARIFDKSIDSLTHLREEEAFAPLPVKWYQVLEGYNQPPDINPEQSGILTYLEVGGLKPVDPLTFEPAQRLNIITGDNGLGKTFLLDLCWWALTQTWADPDLPATPDEDQQLGAFIKFQVTKSGGSRPITVKYSKNEQAWSEVREKSTIPGLVVYARVDGSYNFWDPISTPATKSRETKDARHSFTREEIWEGKKDEIEGLLRDWVRWQERGDKYPEFSVFSKVLHKLLPDDFGPLSIGLPRRILGHPIEIPTLRHPYGDVPIIFESAGFRRVATLAYLIVWVWHEHKAHAKLLGRKEEPQMAIILDEVEAHLHPKWQRKVLPALLTIGTEISAELSLQLIVSTHSPLVLASSEPSFDPEMDKLFHLDISTAGKVNFRRIPFDKRGTIDSWLSSDVFEVLHPGSYERSNALKRAIDLQESTSITKKKVEEITEELRSVLPPEDRFWIRWIMFAEEHGVTV
jgi:hypothetical protein